jgi:conjugative transfer region protein TrbK
MLGPPELSRSIAIVILIALIALAFAETGQRSVPRVVEAPRVPSSSASDDLSAELRRCRTLGPQDAVDSRCVTVWEENHRRFFGKPGRPLPPSSETSFGPAVSTIPTSGGAR